MLSKTLHVSKYFDYFNYWLCYQLKEIRKFPTHYVLFLEGHFDSKFFLYKEYIIFINRAYYINKDAFNQTNGKYNFYKYYNAISTLYAREKIIVLNMIVSVLHSTKKERNNIFHNM